MDKQPMRKLERGEKGKEFLISINDFLYNQTMAQDRCPTGL